jgi:hypothetical protein
MASSAARCAAPARRLRGKHDVDRRSLDRNDLPRYGEAGADAARRRVVREMPRAMERIHEALLACDLFLDAVAPRP